MVRSPTPSSFKQLTTLDIEHENASNSSTTSKRSWLSKISSFVTVRRRGSIDHTAIAERTARSPSPNLARAAVTANWVYQTNSARLTVTVAPIASRSEASLPIAPVAAKAQAPARYERGRVHTASAVKPETYPVPEGPTALTPTPTPSAYSIGRSVSSTHASRTRPRAHTASSSVGDHPYASTSSRLPLGPAPAMRALPPRPPVPSHFPPSNPLATSVHPIFRTPSTQTEEADRNQDLWPSSPPPSSWSHAFSRASVGTMSEELTISDALASWTTGTGENCAASMRRLSAATCASTHTFGV